MSASTLSIPFLSIRRRAALETRRRTQRFSVSTQKRRYCRFGRNRRLVLLLAWETLFPTIGPLPVTSHTRAMWTLFHEQLAPNEPGGLSQQGRCGVFCSLTSPESGGGTPVCRSARSAHIRQSQ